jgi:hypothetical protein
MSLESNLLLLRDERLRFAILLLYAVPCYSSSTIYYGIIWYDLLMISSLVVLYIKMFV